MCKVRAGVWRASSQRLCYTSGPLDKSAGAQELRKRIIWKAGEIAVRQRGSGRSPGGRLVPLGSDGGHCRMLGLDVCVSLLDGHEDGSL